MGRDKTEYKKDLYRQAYERMTSMQAFGQSKKQAMEDGTADDKIFSYSTYQTYFKHLKYYINYVKSAHPDCQTMKSAKQYVKEWLENRSAETIIKNGKEVPKYSAWTIQVEAKALGKYYHIKPDDPSYFQPPTRHREDIKRSRCDAVRDKHFSVTNNAELIKFCQGTGLRREGLSKIKGDCLYSRADIEKKITELQRQQQYCPQLNEKDAKELAALKNTRLFTKENYFIRTTEKGGKTRYSPVIGSPKQQQQIIDRINRTPSFKHVFEHVPEADIHGFRSDFAKSLYLEYARDIKDIPFDRLNKGSGKWYQSDVYTCRSDEKGRKFDRAAMKITSVGLGHSRIDVTVSYLRGL